MNDLTRIRNASEMWTNDPVSNILIVVATAIAGIALVYFLFIYKKEARRR